MPSLTTFDTTVAARTRAADRILNTPDMLTAYEARGGLAGDLQAIRDAGRQAELLSQAQSAAQAAGGAATVAVLADFAALQREYTAVMAIVQAARRDLVKASAPAEIVKAVDRILINEAEVLIKTATDKDGKARKVAVKRVSQEALRAEIAKDARALSALTEVHPTLAQRKVDKTRLDNLAAAADALSGKLADRAAAKGDRKQATSAMHDAVAEQKAAWGACYRLLAALGREDPRVAALLAEAVRVRSKKG